MALEELTREVVLSTDHTAFGAVGREDRHTERAVGLPDLLFHALRRSIDDRLQRRDLAGVGGSLHEANHHRHSGFIAEVG